MKQEKNLTVKLVGGLGNQLFGYFAGLACAINSKRNLLIDMTDVLSPYRSHSSSIESFDIPFEFTQRELQNRYVEKLKAHFTLGIQKVEFLEKCTSEYRSPVVGFDEEILDRNFRKRIISGYFQSYRYHDACPRHLAQIALKRPSIWFREMKCLLSSNSIGVLHVRRGDYKKFRNVHGLLSRDYYERAIEMVEGSLEIDKYLIFSDDVSDAKNSLGSFSEKFEFISPPIGSDPAETLLLMSFASANIIANSTFSWWSAKLSTSTKIVVAPKEWFAGKKEPLDLYPREWQKVSSAWID